METPSSNTPKTEPQNNPPERGRAWRIVAIVLTLHAALLGSVVLIQGCGKSNSTPSVTESSPTSTLTEEHTASLKEEHTSQVQQNVISPNSEVLTPEEHLSNSETSKTTEPSLVEAAKVLDSPPTEQAKPVEPPAIVAPSKASPSLKYSVKKGDTLSKIAKKHAVSVDQLVAANKISAKTPLKLGQKLTIPSHVKLETAKIDKGKGSTAEQVSTAVPVKGKTQKTHIVKSGENLTSIAKRYGVTVQSLLQANRISDPKKIRVSQKLVIPTVKLAREEMIPQNKPSEIQNVKPTVMEEQVDKGKVVQGI